jgi:hypothetical protein
LLIVAGVASGAVVPRVVQRKCTGKPVPIPVPPQATYSDLTSVTVLPGGKMLAGGYWFDGQKEHPLLVKSIAGGPFSAVPVPDMVGAISWLGTLGDSAVVAGEQVPPGGQLDSMLATSDGDNFTIDTTFPLATSQGAPLRQFIRTGAVAGNSVDVFTSYFKEGRLSVVSFVGRPGGPWTSFQIPVLGQETNIGTATALSPTSVAFGGSTRAEGSTIYHSLLGVQDLMSNQPPQIYPITGYPGGDGIRSIVGRRNPLLRPGAGWKRGTLGIAYGGSVSTGSGHFAPRLGFAWSSGGKLLSREVNRQLLTYARHDLDIGVSSMTPTTVGLVITQDVKSPTFQHTWCEDFPDPYDWLNLLLSSDCSTHPPYEHVNAAVQSGGSNKKINIWYGVGSRGASLNSRQAAIIRNDLRCLGFEPK